MSTQNVEQQSSVETESAKPGSLHPDGSALQFKIGDRIYWVSRSRDGNAWRIVANGDLVEQASILHYGDVAAFLMIASRLRGIEHQWAEAGGK